MRALQRTALATVAALALVGGASPALGAPGVDPPGGGGDTGADDTGSLYSDLVLLLRDVHGVPLLAEFVLPDDTGTPVPQYCVQPISYAPLPGVTTTVVNGADGREVYLVPLLGEAMVAGELPPAEDEEEEVEPCDPDPAYGMYVNEAELERLNMARQPADNMARHLAEVTTALQVADTVSLDGAGRLLIDGAVVDAAPKYTAIFRSLMETGTIPGLETLEGDDVDAVPARVGPLDAWGIAATAIGVATGKGVPISIDAVAYYNRIVQVPALYDPDAVGWDMGFFQTTPSDGELFVDYSGFTYDRAAMFPGCATWLDVPTLTWKVVPVAELADFAALPPVADGAGGLTDIAAFAQMADDVRAVINVLHESDVIPGFFIDPVFQESCAAQGSALVEPAVTWGVVPSETVQTDPFVLTASAYLPWSAVPLDAAQLRVVLDSTADLAAGDVDASVAGVPVTFTADGGDLVADLWPAEGKSLAGGARESVPLDVVVAPTAPVGDLTFRLELVDLSTSTVVAQDASTTAVLDDVLTVLWGDVADYAAQGTYASMAARVLNPPTQPVVDGATLRLTVDAPEPFLLPSQVGVWSDAVAMPFTLDAEGDLVGTWPLPDPLATGYDATTTWYLNVGAGSPLGLYVIGVDVLDAGGAVVSTDLTGLTIGAASDEGLTDPGGGGGGGGGGDGDEELPPVAALLETPSTVSASADATFVFAADTDAAGYSCSLDGAAMTACESPVSLTGLADGVHTFGVRATEGAGKVGPTALFTWTVDTTAPSVVLQSVPKAVSLSGDATFTFTSEGAGTTLCALDGAPLERCTSPVRFTGLSRGTHTFVVAGVDAAGNFASASHRWSVLTHDGAFVRALYVDFLGREASDTEVGAWLARMSAGMSRYEVATSMARSDEWISTVVTGYYRDILGRTPDTDGLRHWVRLAQAGMPVGRVAAGFYGSDEYYLRHGGDDVGFITGLYREILGRAPEAAGRQYWLGQLAGGMSRVEVAYGFYQSQENGIRRVQALYRHFLDRPADPSGLRTWPPLVIEQGDLVLAAHLTASEEYYLRAGR